MDAPSHHLVDLPTGTLRVEVREARWPLDALCDFAARRNPRRGFLFVSKVLGRHLPVRPSAMRAAQRALAALVPPDLPGPVLFVGLAETAIALGAGVWESWREATGRRDCAYQHSTRYRLDRPLAATFEEPHSHASRHLLYTPEDPALAALVAAPGTVVLVDDEASTGTTFVNLARCFPGARRFVCAMLTDWSGGAAFAAAMPAPTEVVSLLAGSYEFTSNGVVPAMPGVVGPDVPRDALFEHPGARLGLARPWAPEALPPLRPGERILVLGTGEFVYPPYRLAEALEAAGAEVFVQATTRSPILPGLAVGHTLCFHDHAGEGIPNFLYNVRPGQYDRVLLCHETPAALLDPALLEALDATAWRP